jgi:hypothetical protein
MPKNVVRKTFDRWLAHNDARFRYPPRLVLRRKRYFELQFSGITPAVQCYISKREVIIYAIYQREWWDALADFDVVARRTPTGHYYCDLCTSPQMFPSRAALWVTLSFEPLLAWTNEHFHASQWLWLCRYGGVTWAELKPREDMHARKTSEHVVYACPVIRVSPSNTSGP